MLNRTSDIVHTHNNVRSLPLSDSSRSGGLNRNGHGFWRVIFKLRLRLVRFIALKLFVRLLAQFFLVAALSFFSLVFFLSLTISLSFSEPGLRQRQLRAAGRQGQLRTKLLQSTPSRNSHLFLFLSHSLSLSHKHTHTFLIVLMVASSLTM
jgi:hypothetical protein